MLLYHIYRAGVSKEKRTPVKITWEDHDGKDDSGKPWGSQRVPDNGKYECTGQTEQEDTAVQGSAGSDSERNGRGVSGIFRSRNHGVY